MSKTININGITTNNLKNIDIALEKKAITLIVGPSGSGKSSLAYDTIAQIGQHEFMSMFADDILEPTYRTTGFKNMVAAVPIKQSNFNNNMRSTIGTYFGLSRSVILLYAVISGMPEGVFVLNKEDNLCNYCHGLGFIKTLDENKLIDYDIPLNKVPVRCWNRYKDFYAQIIEQFCIDNGINSSKTYRQLSDAERKLFLYGESQEKYSIRYKKTATVSRRTTKYYGIMTGKPMMVNFSPSVSFFSDQKCPYCRGKKYSITTEQHKVNGLSIGEFLSMPFSNLKAHIERITNSIDDSRLSFALNNIYRFVSKANELHLGHLYFHRAIPTLSGGELQRLRIIQVLNAQLSDLLVVLDEPLAGLSGSERETVYKNILELANRHTVVVVDHSEKFVSSSSKVYALGKKGGIKGGNLIDTAKYFAEQRIGHDFLVSPRGKETHIVLDSNIYHYTGVDITINENCMNLITGSSGVGKSTLLREYFPQYFEKYSYICQKPLLGNKNSCVATALDLSVGISEIFAKKHRKDRHFFTNQTGCEGTCSICGGAGYLEYDCGPRAKTQIICRECNGTGFNKVLEKYKVNGKSIFDIWNMTIDEAIPFFSDVDHKIAESLRNASSILLGHLKIGQSISSLSGGENIRIKILKAQKTSAKILGIDEPFKGLNNTEIFCVAQYLDQLRSKGKTIVVVDHTESARQYFAHIVELECKDGTLTHCN